MAKPILMHQIRRIIELQMQGLPIRHTTRVTGLSRNTIREYIRRITATDLSLQDALALNDSDLSSIVYGDTLAKGVAGRNVDERHEVLKSKLDKYCSELGRHGVTRQLLWEEYRKEHPEGYGYTQFCEYLRQHTRIDQAVMHFVHRPAECLQIDFAGTKLGYVEPSTGEWITCEVLVCVMPFSHYLYVEALPSQKQAPFIAGLVRCLDFLGGVPWSVKVDNMRTAVLRSNRYEPIFTEAMQYFAEHYGTAALAARVGKPRDKASVEKAVDLSYKHVYAPLRNQIFKSIQELNTGIAKQVLLFNNRPFRNKVGTRRQMFEQHEKPLLKTLPSSVYEIKNTTESKVGKNYHVIVGEDRHSYSVPYKLIGKRLKIIYTADSVEIYHNLSRVALHKRNYTHYGHTTNLEHQPVKHQHVTEQSGWDDEYFLRSASCIGQSVLEVMRRMLASRLIEVQTYNSCLGILKLGKAYGSDRLEAACLRLISAPRINYGMVKNVLQNNLDKLTPQQIIPDPPGHTQIRGPEHYQ
jgi:transposase